MKEGQKILVVDDDPTMRLIFNKTLRNAGFAVVEAEDGLAALEVYRRSRGEFAAVLLDLIMPRLDGYETLREIRRHEPSLPVLIVSGVDPAEALAPLPHQNYLGYLKKPIQARRLIHMVRELTAT